MSRLLFLLLWCAAATSHALDSTLEAQASYASGDRAPDGLEVTLTPAIETQGRRTFARASARIRWSSDQRYDGFPIERSAYDDLPGHMERAGRRYSFELRDFYLQRRGANWQVSVGKQNVDWGVLDGLKVLDVVNPQDFREFILADFEDSRISTWSAKGRLQFGQNSFELFWSPDRTVHDLADGGTVYELQAARFAVPGSQRLSELPVVKPDADTWGLRIGRTVGAFDVRLVAIRGFDYEPSIVSRDGRLLRRHGTRRVYGLQLDGTVGPFVIRSELATHPARRNTLGRSRERTASVGVDYAFGRGWFLSSQLLVRHTDPPNRLEDERETIGTVFLRKTLLNERVAISGRWYGTDEGDDLFRIRADVNPGVVPGELFLGADFYQGDRNGIFGQFNDRDQIYVGWRRVWG